MNTEIIYICTPDRHLQILTSLDTLFNSGSNFKQVTIYLVGEANADWRFSEPSIEVKPVPPLFEEYQYGNKVYLCRSTSDRVIFLDTDTFILKNIDSIWEKSRADVIARVAPSYYRPTWNTEIWKDTCSALNIPIIPMFNAGLLMFQNNAHKKIETLWREFIQRYQNKQYAFPHIDVRMPDQFAFALSVGAAGLSYYELSALEHGYGWKQEPIEKTIIYHTGNKDYDKYYCKMKLSSQFKDKLQPAFATPLRMTRTKELFTICKIMLMANYYNFKKNIKDYLKRILPQAIIDLIKGVR